MPQSISISDSKRLNLTRILKQLGLRQNEVAKALAISPTAISRFLSTGSDRINLRPEKLLDLVGVLKDRLADCRSMKSLSTEALAVRRKSGDGSAIDAALALSTVAVKGLEFEIAELLGGDSQPSNITNGPLLVMPGGPLAVRAANYVSRRADGEIEAILTEGRSPSSIITGPVNGGTSSFLNRIYHRAQGIRGCWTCIVH